MKKKNAYVALAVVTIALSVTAAPALALLGPVPVFDIYAEKTWLSQLAQQIATAKSEVQQVELAVQNVTRTNFGWPTSPRNVLAVEPLLDNAVQQLNAYRNTIAIQGGVPVAPDAALQTAEAGMAQLPGEQADLADAQAASDSAPGDLAAQQAGHRIDALQVGDGAKLRQFLYAQEIQRKIDDAEAMDWFTMPLDPSGEAGMENTQT